ncbi:MAG: NADH-quinone oxidoreductase subunit L, partial [bacterium]
MKNEWILLLVVFVPTLGSCLLPLIGNISVQLRNLLALLFVLVSFVGSLFLAPVVLSGGSVLVTHSSLIGSNFFQADKLAVFMALVSSLVGAIIVLYSFGYISHYEYQNEYYFMVVLFLGSMMGLVYSGNLILMYLFWETTAIACWRLIGFFREKAFVFRADKAF